MAHAGRRSADEVLAAELAAGKTVREASAAAGVAERTAFRRLEDAVFKDRISELRSAMVTSAAGRLADGMTEAANVLRALLADADPHIRYKSATKLIELTLKVKELAELETRMVELERRFGDEATR